MTEFSAFLLGLMLGDTRPIPTPIKNKVRLPSNVALQDVVFCQSLRNIIDGLEEYVHDNCPSPQEFIRHVLPEENFEEPYTDAEKHTIENNAKKTADYVKWITSKIDNKTIVGGQRWEDLDAIHMIWQDEAHTPDIEHLDLLFGDSLLSQPIKRNGRVYEYSTIAPLTGLAKGFFNTIPAKVILALCLSNAQAAVAAYGYKYDYSRFEYSRAADVMGRTEEWKKTQRDVAYVKLLRDDPSFCKSPWSDKTSQIKAHVKI